VITISPNSIYKLTTTLHPLNDNNSLLLP